MSSPLAILKTIAFAVLIIGAGIAGWYYYHQNQSATFPVDIASGNGRIEATEYDIATKYAGRLHQVIADEGQMVEANQVLAQMDTENLEAQLREARAKLREAQENREYASAIVTVRETEMNYAQRELDRTHRLAQSNHISQDDLDQARTKYETARASLKAARIQVTQADAGIEAAEAGIARLENELGDMRLSSPIQGRVLYKLAQAGEVLGAGGKVMTVLDLTDVYMTIFLPTDQAGKIRIGSEARIILDAAPQYIIPASVSFVAPRTQFTPKSVETRSEREKLMFRVKVKISPQLLKQYIEVVKTGVPGEAYVRLDPEQPWPAQLEVRLPE